MKNKKCLVFGGGGFIGSNLCEQLLKNDYDVCVFDRPGFDRKNLEHISGEIRIIEGDFSNVVDVENAIDGIHFIFHLISSTIPSISMDNHIFDIETNLISSVGLMQAIQRSKTFERIIFLSSGGTVYGIPKTIPIPETHPTDPISSYGIIKATIERYLLLYKHVHKTDVLIFRLSNPYGQHQNPDGKQGVIPVFLKKIMTNQTIDIWGDGSVVRDYISVQDVVELMVISLATNTGRNIYNLGSGEGHTLNDLIRLMETIVGRKANVKYHNPRSFDVPSNILDISSTMANFAWKPKVNLHDGIKDLYQYFTKLLKA